MYYDEMQEINYGYDDPQPTEFEIEQMQIMEELYFWDMVYPTLSTEEKKRLGLE